MQPTLHPDSIINPVSLLSVEQPWLQYNNFTSDSFWLILLTFCTLTPCTFYHSLLKFQMAFYKGSKFYWNYTSRSIDFLETWNYFQLLFRNFVEKFSTGLTSIEANIDWEVVIRISSWFMSHNQIFPPPSTQQLWLLRIIFE